MFCTENRTKPDCHPSSHCKVPFPNAVLMRGREHVTYMTVIMGLSKMSGMVLTRTDPEHILKPKVNPGPVTQSKLKELK